MLGGAKEEESKQERRRGVQEQDKLGTSSQTCQESVRKVGVGRGMGYEARPTFALAVSMHAAQYPLSTKSREWRQSARTHNGPLL